MVYRIEIGASASKELAKLDSSVRAIVKKKIDALADNPQKGKPLGVNDKLGDPIWELRLFSPNVRIYYTIHKCEIIIEEIVYEGAVRIHKIGDKRSQRRDINGLS